MFMILKLSEISPYFAKRGENLAKYFIHLILQLLKLQHPAPDRSKHGTDSLKNVLKGYSHEIWMSVLGVSQ
jgi:hypothetical protein